MSEVPRKGFCELLLTLQMTRDDREYFFRLFPSWHKLKASRSPSASLAAFNWISPRWQFSSQASPFRSSPCSSLSSICLINSCSLVSYTATIKPELFLLFTGASFYPHKTFKLFIESDFRKAWEIAFIVRPGSSAGLRISLPSHPQRLASKDLIFFPLIEPLKAAYNLFMRCLKTESHSLQ